MFRRQFRHFVVTTKTTQPRPQVFSVNGSITCNRMHFWRHFDVIGSISQFGQQQLVMVSYTCGFDQSETGKYFEWIIMNNFIYRFIHFFALFKFSAPSTIHALNPFHSIPLLFTGSFAVDNCGHLRSGIICGRGSFGNIERLFLPSLFLTPSTADPTLPVYVQTECLKPAFF